MDKPFLLLLLALLPVLTQAQTPQIDSFKQALLTEKRDTSRVMLLWELGWAFFYSKPDTTMTLAQQVLTKSRELKFVKGEAWGTILIADLITRTGNYPNALQLSLDALKKFEQVKDEKGRCHALLALANVYFFQGDYRKGLDYTYQAAMIAENIHDDLQLNISYSNIADTYEKLNKLDSAQLYTQKAYQIALKLNDKQGTAIAFATLGNIYAKMGQQNLALEYYRTSIRNLLVLGDFDLSCEYTLNMARIFKDQKQSDSSLFYAKLSMKTAEKAGYGIYVVDAANFLNEYYKNKKNIDSAYFFLNIASFAKDSLFNQEKTKLLQNLSLTETLRQQELEGQRRAAAEEQKHNLQYAAIAVSIVLFVILFLLLSRSIIVNEKWIEFLGVLGLLLLFEFVNLLIHPFLGAVTHHSPVLMLLAMVAIAALLVPLHHRVEHWVTHQMIAKNKRLRLTAARKTIAKLEGDPDTKE
jgi:tetratricopeptide (TPR) repeat protein